MSCRFHPGDFVVFRGPPDHIWRGHRHNESIEVKFPAGTVGLVICNSANGTFMVLLEQGQCIKAISAVMWKEGDPVEERECAPWH